MFRSLSRLALLVLLTPLAALSQTALEPSTTNLTSNSSTLQLPGQLLLSASVTHTAANAGLPTGNVSFYYDTTHLIGTAATRLLPLNQSFETPATTDSFGNAPYGLLTMKFPSSNRPVLAVLDYYFQLQGYYYYPQLTIFSGKGTQLFQASASYQITNSLIDPYGEGNIDAVGTGDFNHDGIPDVIIHGYTGNSSGNGNEYYVLLGNPDGTYNIANNVLTPDNSGTECDCSNPTELIAVDDFNGDGYSDVAYVENGNDSYSTGVVGIALNGGTGANPAYSFSTFTNAPPSQIAALSASGIATGHFTASGHADVAVVGVRTGVESVTGWVQLYLGGGDGTLAPENTQFQVGNSPSAIAVGDFNKDGHLDIVVANREDGTLSVLLGNGQGSFDAAQSVTVNGSPGAITVSDIDGDGYPDLVVTDSVTGAQNTLRNKGDGTFFLPITIGTTPSQPVITAVGDFNSDGLPDVAGITTYGVDDSGTAQVSELLNSSDSFVQFSTPLQSIPAGSHTLTAVYAGDTNFATSTSAGVDETVTQTPTSINWPAPADIEYGTPLSGTQLNATGSVPGNITYNPAAGAILPPGYNQLGATLTPTDSFDYAASTGVQYITVTQPSVTSIAPSSAQAGSPSTTITITGQGLVNGAVAYWNSTALATTFVNLNQLTAVVPAALLATGGTYTVTVTDPNSVPVSGSAAFVVSAVYVPSASTTSLTSNSPTLQLPGQLNLDALVGHAASNGGVASGNVSFYYDTTHLLGTMALQILPGTESFETPATTNQFGSTPYGLLTMNLNSSKKSFLAVLDYYLVQSEGTIYYPQLTIFSGKGSELFQTSASYQLTNASIGGFSNNVVDAALTGDFNHDGIPDVLLHGIDQLGEGENTYYVLFGNGDGTFNQSTAVTSPDNSGNTSAELIAIDDFNGDGYSDAAYVQNGSTPGGNVGVALNSGASGSPAYSFSQFITAPMPQSGGLLASAITTGHFTSSGHADVAVIGTFVEGTQGYIQLYLGKGDGTLAPQATPIPVGHTPSAIATGDFNKDGKTDVVVANKGDGTVEVLFGDGLGNLADPQTGDLITVGSSPSDVKVADLNGDGYPDILVTDSGDGSQRVILNDGTGHFGAPTIIGTAPGQASLSAIGDFNADGLPDVAEITTNGVNDTTTSQVAALLNSANAQAALTTPLQSIPSGSHTLTAIYAGDTNFVTSTSTGVAETVTQTATALTWPTPAQIGYGTPLSGTQLNATSSVPGNILYNPAAGAVLPPGSNTLNAVFTPTDAFDYAGSSAMQTLVVTAPTLTSISPASAQAGAAATTITLNGQGFVSGAIAKWNGTPLATTFVNVNQLTAVVPATLLTTAGFDTVTVTDPNNVAVAGSQIFSVYGQQAASGSTTSLSSNSPTLLLPGSLNLTATVNQPAVAGGVPTGSVNFFYGGTNSLGTGPLTPLPNTEKFVGPYTTQPFGNSPYGLLSLKFGASKQSVVAALDYTYNAANEDYNPELTIFSGKGAALFQSSASYQILNSGILDDVTGVDAVATGDFNHDGIPDVLLRGIAESDPDGDNYVYYVAFGNANGTFTPNTGVMSVDGSGTRSAELLAVDDFNGDGNADVAYAAVNSPSAAIGVALNGGSGAGYAFTSFLAAPTPSSGQLTPTGIATGHFTSSGHADVAVVGTLDSTQGYIQVYLGAGNGTLAPTTALAQVGHTPSAIATGDFNKDGKTDVVVANKGDGTVEVLFGDGTGNLAVPQTGDLISVGSSPSAISVADFNGDGYPDILVTDGGDGSQRVILNDGTGHFGTPVLIGTAVGQALLSTVGDFNGDGLPDAAGITSTPVGQASSSTAEVAINSASAQATLTTAPQTLPAGTQSLTATFSGDSDFNGSTSTGLQEVVSQTVSTLTWAAPAQIEYGTPLSATQLNATSSVAGSIIYNPAVGAILPPGSNALHAVFTPTDSFDYTGTTASQTIMVSGPSLTSITPNQAKLGSPNITITLNGQGFVNGAAAKFNGTALATTFVNLNQLTAVVPANLLANAGAFAVTVVDPNQVAVSGSQVFTVLGAGQQLRPVSTTALTSNSPTLMLPGSLTLTANVNEPAIAGGVPSGVVNFLSDGTTSLGSAPLKVLPATQSFPGTPSSNPLTSGSDPVGLASVKLSASRPVIVSADGGTGDVTLYDFSASLVTPTRYVYNLNAAIDAVNSGYFLQPQSSAIQSFLVHSPRNANGTGEYAVFDGSVSTANLALNPPVKINISGCDCSNPDNETIAIDDFDGDGYSDIASLSNPFDTGGVTIVGVTPNAGAASPGTFTPGSFLPAPVPSNFCATAIATGHFTAATGAQLAILGRTPSSASCESIAATDPASIYVYGLNASKNALVELGTLSADSTATTLAAADLNNDGKADLIIGESTAQSVKVAIGNGDGTFAAPSAPVNALGAPTAFNVADFNGDGYPDVGVTLRNQAGGGFIVLFNDGKGNLSTTTAPYALQTSALAIASADLNQDGLPDLALLLPGNDSGNGSIDLQLNSASAQATLTTPAQALPSGTHMLTATFPGDANFDGSTSTSLQEMVNQTVSMLAWATPAPIEFGVPLSGTQLNAVASVPGVIVYNPPAGTVLSPGSHPLAAVFTPTDTFDYTSASASQTIVVSGPSLTSIAPNTAKLGDPATTIVANGQGFSSGAVIMFNATPLATTFVNINQLQAIIPASLLTTAGNFTITVVDANKVTVAGSQVFSVTASAPTATVSASATLTSGSQGSLTLSVSPYPAAITAVLNLTFTPAPPISVTDPAVLFANNSTTETIQIAANSTAAIPPIGIQAGSTAGTITVNIQLFAGGANITPTTLLPVSIAVPNGPPTITAVVVARTGMTLQVVVDGLSPSRDMAQAVFHFTPAPGKSLKTADVPVSLTAVFSAWYASGASDPFGTTFVYTQPFTLDSPATDVESVTVTLTNSQGASQPAAAQ